MLQAPLQELFHGFVRIICPGDEDILAGSGKVIQQPPSHAPRDDHLAIIECAEDTTMGMVVPVSVVTFVIMTVPVMVRLALGMAGKVVFNVRFVVDAPVLHIKDQKAPGPAKMTGNPDPVIGCDCYFHISCV